MTFAGHQVSWLVPVAGLSVIAAVIAVVAGIGAARVLGAALSSFVGLTEVLFAFAWFALGEVPTLMQAMGGVLIIAGIALARAGMLPVAHRAPHGVSKSHCIGVVSERRMAG